MCRSTAESCAAIDSPVSNDGCGLKLVLAAQVGVAVEDSPVSNDGCGLKLEQRQLVAGGAGGIHPSAMTGVG